MPLAHRILMSAALAEVDTKGNAQTRAAMSDLLIMGSPGLKTAALNRNIDLILEPPRRQGGGCTNATGAMSVRVLVFGRRQQEASAGSPDRRPKKRQGTKSREVGHRLSSGRYEDLMPAPLSMVSATRGRGDVQCLHTGEKIVQRGISAGV